MFYQNQKRAPILTIFVGGNHEATNYLRDLYYGGWAAENIYFLGASGVINVYSNELQRKFRLLKVMRL